MRLQQSFFTLTDERRFVIVGDRPGGLGAAEIEEDFSSAGRRQQAREPFPPLPRARTREVAGEPQQQHLARQKVTPDGSRGGTGPCPRAGPPRGRAAGGGTSLADAAERSILPVLLCEAK